MEPMTIKVESTFFDLELFDDVPVVKTAEFTAPESMEAALKTLGNDSSKLLAIIVDGMIAQTKRDMRNDAAGWHTYNEDGSVNGVYTGAAADPKKVNPFVLNLAKTVFGFDKSLAKEEKRLRKEKAIEWIKNSPEIRAGLAVNCAIDTE
jgi:hypothetical protein